MSRAVGHFQVAFTKQQLADFAVDKQEVVSIAANASVSAAMQEMCFRKLSSLPLKDALSGEFVGVVNAVDLATFIAFGVFPYGVDVDAVHIDDVVPRLVSTPVSALLGVTDESRRVWAFAETDPVELVLEPFCRGVHRVLIESRSGPCRVVTQTDVLRQLMKQKDVAITDGALARTLNDAGLVPPSRVGKVASVPSTATALNAFRKLSQSQWTALAVLNAAGELVGNLSASDVRSVFADQLPQELKKSVEQFLVAQGGGKPTHPITASATDKVEDVIQKMLLAHVHHVWVVDAAQKPVVCVSMSDIVAALASL